jgi:gas vesicle protein
MRLLRLAEVWLTKVIKHGLENTMVTLASSMAEGSSYTAAVFGLAGSLIGGSIAATVSLLIARQARKAAETTWIRDNRRETYDRFLTYAERLLIACEACKDTHRDDTTAKASVETAFTNFWQVYGVVQTVADTRLVEAARTYAYRLWELAASLGSTSVMGPGNFRQVAELIRDARYNMITEMRAELGLGSFQRGGGGNPFAGTDLEEKYDKAPRSRPGPLVLSQGDPTEPEL